MKLIFFILIVVFLFLESISFVMLKDSDLRYNQMRWGGKVYLQRFFYPGLIWIFIASSYIISFKLELIKSVPFCLLLIEAYNFVLFFSIKAYKKVMQCNIVVKISYRLRIKNKSITFQQETLLTIDVILLLVAILLPWIKHAKIVPAFAIIAMNVIAINISCRKYKILIYTLSIIAIILVFILKFCYNYYS